MRVEGRKRNVAPVVLAMIVAGSVAGLMGCSPDVVEVAPADDIYAAATKDFEDEDYGAAVQRYRQFLDHYPLDPRTQEVEYRIAQAHYRDESYAEAITAFSDFQRMYPTSPRLPEVEYTIAQAHMDQMDAIDRDLASARNAHERFRSVMLRYPGTDYAEKASTKLQQCREHLAERELYIASFYFDRSQLRAGETRVKGLIDRYPDTDAATRALRLLSSAAADAGEAELGQLAENAAVELESERSASPDGATAGKVQGGAALAALRAKLDTTIVAPAPDPTDAS
jgi:outer membrane protein assembly factor BamD